MSTFAKKVTSAVLTSALVLTTAGSTAGVSAALMGNIAAANTLANNNVIVDQSSNPSAYRLADTIQRKEALKVMMKLSGNTISTGACTSPFADIADSDWACKYAVAALSAGFIADNTNFRPDDNVSKIEALKMVMKARGIEKSSNADWKAAYVEAAVSAEIAETFSDYNTASTRGTMFVWAAEAINSANTDTEDLEIDFGDLFGDTTEETTTEETTTEETTTEETTTEDTSSAADELVVSINAESPTDGLAPADTNRVTLLKFDVKAGSEDVTLNEATFNFIGLGDYTNLDEVSIYNSLGEKVSKTKNFSEIERKISFDKNIVVEAGTTMTLTVAGKLSTGGSDNATYGIKLVDIKASSTVMGEDVVGALLVPATFANVAGLKVNANKQSGNITIGDTETLVKFDVEETNDNEDVVIKTITLHTTGSADEDDLSNLEVYIEGSKVDSTLTVNSDEEIVMALDYTLAADEKVTIEVKGSITGSVGDTVDFTFESNDDVYAIGATSGMPVVVSTTLTSEDLSTARLVEGSEINVSFEKGDRDEATPDSTDVNVGTLKLLALTDNYEIKKLTVTVKSSNGNIEDVIENVELGGLSEDAVTGENTTTAVYTFEDISLSANETKDLALTFDVLDDNTLNGTNLDFQVAITEVNDDIEDKDYTSTSTPALSTILSSTALDNKDIDIKTGSITIANVDVIDRELVIGNGVETVLYKAKITTGDAEAITINDFNLIDNGSTITEDLDKVLDSATLNIGGKTFSADIDNDSVDFTGINAEIAADSNGVEVLVTAVLKDNDNVTNDQYIKLQLDTANLDIDDSKGDTLAASSIFTTSANSKPTKTILKSQGTFEFAIINNGDNKDDIENVVLAGSNDVALAEFKMEADLEDIDVNSLKIKIPVGITTPANLAIAPTVAGTVGNVATPADYTGDITKVELETSVELETGDKLYVTVNGTTYTQEVTSSHAAALAELANAITTGEANVDSSNVNGNVIELTSTASNSIDITYPAINSNGITKTLTATTTQAPLTVGSVTVTLDRAIFIGDSASITVNGQTYSYTSDLNNDLEDLAAKVVAADANVASATESTDGTVITITGKADGTPVVVTATATPKPAVVSGDYSDTLSNVRLMNGSTVIASTDDIELVGSDTVITFNDFTVEDGESSIEGVIVANIEKYTTNGDETSAELGNVVISAFVPADADVEGISSDNTITATEFTGNTDSTTVAIVPATVDVAVTQSFGVNETEAKLTFTVNKGNNTFDDDSVAITGLTLTANGNALATGTDLSEINSIDNDDNATVTTTNPEDYTSLSGNNTIVSGDVWTFNIDTIIGKDDKIKLGANGVTFSINGNIYNSTNDDEITLGTYSN